MSFISITTGEITSGQPVSSTTQGKIKTNFDDHESRLESIESGSSVQYPAALMEVNGRYSILGSLDKILVSTTNMNVQITGVRLGILNAGSTGTTSARLQFKRGAGSWTNILSTPVTMPSSAGDYSLSTAATLDPTYTSLMAGDLIAVDLVSSQANASGFYLRIDFIRI
jgi:hypothetical protein